MLRYLLFIVIMPTKRLKFLRKWKRKKGKVDNQEQELQQVVVHKPIRLSYLKREADEVKEVLHDNIVKLRDREGKLDDLVEKGETLEREAEQFQKNTKKVKRKMLMRSRKCTIVLISIGLILLIVVTIVILFATGVI